MKKMLPKRSEKMFVNFKFSEYSPDNSGYFPVIPLLNNSQSNIQIIHNAFFVTRSGTIHLNQHSRNLYLSGHKLLNYNENQ